MMKTPVLAAILLGGTLVAGCATGNGYSYGDRVYSSRAECLQAKRSAQRTGTVVGALGGAATGAVLGGNVGETALAAGVGALGGNVLSGRNRPC